MEVSKFLPPPAHQNRPTFYSLPRDIVGEICHFLKLEEIATFSGINRWFYKVLNENVEEYKRLVPIRRAIFQHKYEIKELSHKDLRNFKNSFEMTKSATYDRYTAQVINDSLFFFIGDRHFHIREFDDWFVKPKSAVTHVFLSSKDLSIDLQTEETVEGNYSSYSKKTIYNRPLRIVWTPSGSPPPSELARSSRLMRIKTICIRAWQNDNEPRIFLGLGTCLTAILPPLSSLLTSGSCALWRSLKIDGFHPECVDEAEDRPITLVITIACCIVTLVLAIPSFFYQCKKESVRLNQHDNS